MIRIKNIYYMLAYAFQSLNAQGYRSIATEEFDNTAELCAAILACGVGILVKRGLGKEYIPKTEALLSLRGKIDFCATIKTQALLRKRVVCSYDDYSVDSYRNRIIKSTMHLLLRANIATARKKELRKLIVFFNGVDMVDLRFVNWAMQYNRSNQHYQTLISICYLTVKGLLHTNADGSTMLADFLDEQRMHRLYEKFILEYYRKEFPQISANAARIPWQLDDGVGYMLPLMQSDIMLSRGNKYLIIDAKYYANSIQLHYGRRTLHSGNMYQIFTYVKNKDIELGGAPHEVSGLLLYARTDEDVYPENEYRMSGNRIEVRTLNLDCDFGLIRAQLDGIVEKYL